MPFARPRPRPGARELTVVSEVRARRRDALSVAEAAHVLPDDLLVTERRPSVALGLLDEGVPGAADGRAEEGHAGDGIVEGLHVVAGLVHLGEEVRGLPVSAVLRVVPVEVADAVGNLMRAAPAQVLLRGLLARPVGLLAHELLRADDGVALLRVCFGGHLLSHEERPHGVRKAKSLSTHGTSDEEEASEGTSGTHSTRSFAQLLGTGAAGRGDEVEATQGKGRGREGKELGGRVGRNLHLAIGWRTSCSGKCVERLK